ncbi:MAG: hypothetical protein ABSE51_02130 [Terracidiphilus sp.]
MKHAAVSLALIFGAITLAAQSAGQQPSTFTVQLPPGNLACPVAMHARQGVNGDLLAVKKSGPKGAAQSLHLILSNVGSKQIISGEVTVHGLTAKGRVTKASSAEDDTSDVMRTLPVTFFAGANGDVSADLWVPGLTAIHSVDLNSVTYADGSTWKLPAGSACRTIPDPNMLVSGR